MNGTIKSKSDRLCTILKQHCLSLSPKKLNRLAHYCCQNSGSTKNQTSFGVFENHRIISQVFQLVCRSLWGEKSVFNTNSAPNTDLFFLIHPTGFCNSILSSFPPTWLICLISYRIYQLDFCLEIRKSDCVMPLLAQFHIRKFIKICWGTFPNNQTYPCVSFRAIHRFWMAQGMNGCYIRMTECERIGGNSL